MSILTAWQCVSPEVTVKGFLKSAVYPVQWMGLMMICCGLWDGSEEDGNVKPVRKMKALSEDGDGDTDW
jgi:hypothetical protein